MNVGTTIHVGDLVAAATRHAQARGAYAESMADLAGRGTDIARVLRHGGGPGDADLLSTVAVARARLERVDDERAALGAALESVLAAAKQSRDPAVRAAVVDQLHRFDVATVVPTGSVNPDGPLKRFGVSTGAGAVGFGIGGVAGEFVGQFGARALDLSTTTGHWFAAGLAAVLTPTVALAGRQGTSSLDTFTSAAVLDELESGITQAMHGAKRVQLRPLGNVDWNDLTQFRDIDRRRLPELLQSLAAEGATEGEAALVRAVGIPGSIEAAIPVHRARIELDFQEVAIARGWEAEEQAAREAVVAASRFNAHAEQQSAAALEEIIAGTLERARAHVFGAAAPLRELGDAAPRIDEVVVHPSYEPEPIPAELLSRRR